MADEQVSAADQTQIDDLQARLDRASKAAIDICAVWGDIKPAWPTVVKLAKLIPKVGAKVSDILQRVGHLLDAYCTSR
jgi:hypothetical protein